LSAIDLDEFDGSLTDTLNRQHCRFNFAQLDTVTAQFDLPVKASLKMQVAIGP
jgi:hypothetical protein